MGFNGQLKLVHTRSTLKPCPNHVLSTVLKTADQDIYYKEFNKKVGDLFTY